MANHTRERPHYKRGIAAVLLRKKRGYPKVIICDTEDQGEVEAVMSNLQAFAGVGRYFLEYRTFTATDPTRKGE